MAFSVRALLKAILFSQRKLSSLGNVNAINAYCEVKVAGMSAASGTDVLNGKQQVKDKCDASCSATGHYAKSSTFVSNPSAPT